MLTEEQARALRWPRIDPNGPKYDRPVPVPSLATLRKIGWLNKLHVSPETAARAIRRVMRGAALDPYCYAQGSMRIASAAAVLDKLNPLLETFGVERIADADDRLRFVYLNTGDTYTATIGFYVPTRSWRVTSWGDVVEADERNGVKYR